MDVTEAIEIFFKYLVKNMVILISFIYIKYTCNIKCIKLRRDLSPPWLINVSWWEG